MEKKIKDLTTDELELLINKTVHKAFEDISEDILALSSKEYIKSIEEAREDFKKKKTKTFKEVFSV
jgi:hypothetical protein